MLGAHTGCCSDGSRPEAVIGRGFACERYRGWSGIFGRLVLSLGPYKFEIRQDTISQNVNPLIIVLAT